MPRLHASRRVPSAREAVTRTEQRTRSRSLTARRIAYYRFHRRRRPKRVWEVHRQPAKRPCVLGVLWICVPAQLIFVLGGIHRFVAVSLPGRSVRGGKGVRSDSCLKSKCHACSIAWHRVGSHLPPGPHPVIVKHPPPLREAG